MIEFQIPSLMCSIAARVRLLQLLAFLVERVRLAPSVIEVRDLIERSIAEALHDLARYEPAAEPAAEIPA